MVRGRRGGEFSDNTTTCFIHVHMRIRLGVYGGYGNSFHGDGGRGTKLAQLRHCLHVLVSMVGTQDSFILEELCDQGILPILTGTYVGLYIQR